jgi:putative membrane protein
MAAQEFFRLLLGTIIFRPYVYGFFVCFLFFAIRHFGLKSTLLYMFTSYTLAFLCEYSATRNGFPFGIYTYIDKTRTRELWISNIPFWDSLSFVFLSYFSWIVASFALSPLKPYAALFKFQTAILAGFLMMLLDLVIDPVALQGEHWFLGQIYFYPNGGSYFGVTLSNFIGWFFVGTLTVAVAQVLKLGPASANRSSQPDIKQGGASLGVYFGVFLFNLTMTAVIGRWDIFTASTLIITVTMACLFFRVKRALLCSF